MRTTGALLVVIVAITLLWMAATGRLNNIAAAWSAIRGVPAGGGVAGTGITTAPASGASGTGISPANLLSWLPPLGFPSTGVAPVIPVPTPGPVLA